MRPPMTTFKTAISMPRLLSRALTVCLVAGSVNLAAARDGDVRLPDIGSSAAALMSQSEQDDYGASVLRELRSYGIVLDDPLLNDYLYGLGHRLAAVSNRPDLKFTFFIVRDNEINAFAVPGGYIGVNAGLINVMRREDQLAGVVGHEIAHVTQQHLLRAYEDMRKASLPIALAMIGAMIATAGRSDDAAQAALVSGTALIQQKQIDFTRSDETEADRFGIQALAKAGFDPHAMADAFTELGRVMRVNGIDVPEFLRTHPVDVNRIADAKARADALETSSTSRREQFSSLTPTKPISGGLLGAWKTPDIAVATDGTSASNDYYLLMRERSRVLAAESAQKMAAYYSKNFRDNSAFDTTANRYGYALALTRADQAAKARDELMKLTEANPGQPVFQLALAQAMEINGERVAAEKRFEGLQQNYPGNRVYALALANALIARGDAVPARRAQSLLRPLLENYANDPDLQRSFARASELSGDKVRAAEAYADVAWLNGRAEDAIGQLQALAAKSELDYYQRARIDARIAQMTPQVLELRRRG
ncbi:MAG: M48 family metalloprotease, partial [Dokdonella sp.]